jgi:hypothetical protein
MRDMPEQRPALSQRPAFSDRTGLSELGEGQYEDYRSVSRLAVCAFVLGLLAPLSLMHPLLFAVPWIGLIVSWRALHNVTQPSSSDSGYVLAISGLVLALVFGSWAPAKLTVEHFVLSRQARQFSERWIDLVRSGKLQDAHRWMLAPIQRPDPSMPTQLFYEENVELQEDLDEEFNNEPGNLIASSGKDSTLYYLGVDNITGKTINREITLLFEITFENSERPSVRFLTNVRRVIEDGVARWQMKRVLEPI